MAGAEKQLSHGKAWPPKIHSMPTTESIPETRLADPASRLPGTAKVEIVVPVRNEERDLGPSIRRLRRYLDDAFPCSTRITIADNGSTDGTWAQARALAADLRGVRAVQIHRPGRGFFAAGGGVGIGSLSGIKTPHLRRSPSSWR